MKFSIGRGIDRSDEQKVTDRKKVLIIAAGVATLAITSTATYLVTARSANKPNGETAGTVEIKRDACKLLPLSDAKKVLGDSAKASNNNANAVSSKATVSTCSYSANNADPEKIVALTVLVRTSNPIQAQQAFEVAKTDGSQDVNNLGARAYFTADKKQLNLLKDESWIIVAATTGKDQTGSEKTAKNSAQIILKRL